MLAASPLRNSTDDGRVVDLGGFAAAATTTSSDGLVILDDIDFDDIFIGFDDCDVLPDLEVDPAEIFAEFSASGEDETSSVSVVTPVAVEASGGGGEQEQEKVVQEAMESDGGGAEVEKKREEEDGAATVTTKPSSESDGGRKSGSPGPKNAQGKRKVKVDWTPELHRRFVQAVEQLGVDKAVPSRILELMGIECLTRHNIASHLQKYRSHRKHLLAREAEAASWSQRRQMYAAAAASGGAVTKREVAPWLTPTIGFPPPPVQPFRPPLHVWGHPTVDQPPMLHMWPRHLVPSPPWAPQPPLQPTVDSSFWHPHFQRGGKEGWIPGAVTPGTPCFPQPMRFPVQPVPGIVPHALYSPHNAVPSKQPGTQFQFETHPSKESIDAAIGDVLAKPWLPLPLGLKPPSLDSVIVELQRQGISRVPPTCG